MHYKGVTLYLFYDIITFVTLVNVVLEVNYGKTYKNAIPH